MLSMSLYIYLLFYVYVVTQKYCCNCEEKTCGGGLCIKALQKLFTWRIVKHLSDIWTTFIKRHYNVRVPGVWAIDGTYKHNIYMKSS